MVAVGSHFQRRSLGLKTGSICDLKLDKNFCPISDDEWINRLKNSQNPKVGSTKGNASQWMFLSNPEAVHVRTEPTNQSQDKED
jgi:hypothetical protein